MSDDLLDQDAAAFAAANRPAPRVPIADQIPLPAPRPPRNDVFWHMFWTIPLAAFVSVPLWFMAAIVRCGFYSCGWGGQTGMPGLSLILCVFIGALWALAIGIPSSRDFMSRRTTAIVTGTIVTVISGLAVWSSN